MEKTRETQMLRKKEFWGVIVLILGLILLVQNLEFIDYATRQTINHLWPILLIIIGFAILARNRSSVSTKRDRSDTPERQGIPYSGQRTRQLFGDLNIMAGGDEIDGREYTTVFGDLDLNLLGVALKPGSNRLGLSAVFGDIAVLVPGNIELTVRAVTGFGDLSVFGQRQSGFGSTLTYTSPAHNETESTIQIVARTRFGNVSVNRV
jgi:lia operon protein LiaF